MPLMGFVFYFLLTMRFKVPGQSVSVRLFERVETKDSQYDIFDVGIEQEDGSIDSIVVGGSFSYAKSLARQADENAAKKTAADASPAANAPAPVAVPVAAPAAA